MARVFCPQVLGKESTQPPHEDRPLLRSEGDSGFTREVMDWQMGLARTAAAAYADRWAQVEDKFMSYRRPDRNHLTAEEKRKKQLEFGAVVIGFIVALITLVTVLIQLLENNALKYKDDAIAYRSTQTTIVQLTIQANAISTQMVLISTQQALETRVSELANIAATYESANIVIVSESGPKTTRTYEVQNAQIQLTSVANQLISSYATQTAISTNAFSIKPTNTPRIYPTPTKWNGKPITAIVNDKTGCSKPVNVRSVPSKDEPSRGALYAGDKVFITGWTSYFYRWYQIAVSDKTSALNGMWVINLYTNDNGSPCRTFYTEDGQEITNLPQEMYIVYP
jgi:hypothetical protein